MQITRRSEPTKLDQAQKGTICLVTKVHNNMIYGHVLLETEILRYIQTNIDEQNPIWELVNDQF
jgi:hypothetical protein